MLRRLFAPRKRCAPAPRSRIQLNLEQLEKREVLDAALVQGLDYLTLNAYQTAQQIGQLQNTTQTDLNHFHQHYTSYTNGQGVTIGQLNQDINLLRQDANSIQGLNSTFQRDVQNILMGLMWNANNISSGDYDSLFVDAYFLQAGQGMVNTALQTAHEATLAGPPMRPLAASPGPSETSPTSPGGSSTPADPQLVTLTLNPLNVNLLGLNVTTNKIQVNISAQPGQGALLGNVLGDVSNLLNLPAVNKVVNQILGNVVSLLNSGSLSVAGVNTSSGSFSSPGSNTTSTTSVLTLHVAPVKLDLLGAVVTTSPIDLKITAQSGQGLVLGNIVSDLANLFNPPLPKQLSLDTINTDLGNLLNEVNQQLPNVGSTPPPVTLSQGQFLALEVSPINVNLLGLILQTSPIQINAFTRTGNGDLLGNIGKTLLNTVDATPTNLATFNNDLNAILGKVIGVLNASTLTLPTNAISSLSPVLQELTSPTLINSSGTATAPILNLAIASPNGGTPVNVNLLGLDITTSNIQAQLLAQTGQGQVLGNLLYNLANLLNPGGTAALLPILGALGL